MFKVYKFDVFSPLHFTLVLLFFYVLFKYVLFYFGFSKYSVGTFKSEGFVLFLVFFQLLSFCFFYFLFNKISFARFFIFIKKSLLFPKKNNFRLSGLNSLILLFFIIFIYEIYYLSVGLSFSQYGKMNPIDIKLSGSNNPISYLLFKGLSDRLLSVMILILSFTCLIKKKLHFILLFYLLTVFVIAFYSGSRGMFIFFGIFPLLIVYNCFKKRLTFYQLFFLFLSVLFLIGILGLLRVSSTGMSFGQFLSLVSNQEDQLTNLFITVLDRRFDSYFPNLFICFDHIESFQYRYGYDYFLMILQFIPRFIWENKPLSLVRELNNTIGFQSTGGVGINSLLESWFNFWIFGLILNGLIGGLLLNFFQKLYYYSIAHNDIFCLAFVLYFGMGMINRIYISGGLTHNSISIFIDLFLFYFSVLIVRFFCFKFIYRK